MEPLNTQYADSPSVDQCDVEREKAFAKLGTIDKKMLVGEHVATCALYIIHRTHSGNVALVTRGLSDPSGDTPGTTGLGIELLAEAKEADVGTGAVLGASYLFQMMHEVSGNCRQFGLRLRGLIEQHQFVSMELNNVEAPPAFTDPHSNRTCALLGVSSPDVPESFVMPGPGQPKVKIVTVRLLSFDECLVVRRFGASGRKALAELFARDGTHHVSSIRTPSRDSIDLALRELKTHALVPEVPLTAAVVGDHRVVVEFTRTARPKDNVIWEVTSIRKRISDLQHAACDQL